MSLDQFEAEVTNLRGCLRSSEEGARLLRVLWVEMSRGATVDHLIHRIRPYADPHTEDGADE